MIHVKWFGLGLLTLAAILTFPVWGLFYGIYRMGSMPDRLKREEREWAERYDRAARLQAEYQKRLYTAGPRI